MSRRKQRSAFDQVSEFDRGRIVAYRDCGLSFREIGSRVGRNQTTVMRICDRWMQEGTTDRRGRSHPTQCTTSSECSVHKTSIAWSTLDTEPQTTLHRHIGPAPVIMVRGGIGYHFRTPLVRIAGTLNIQRYIFEVLDPVVLPYLQGLDTAIFQQDNARPHLITLPAATPDQLWQRVEAAWSAVLQEHIQSLFEPMPRRLAAIISNNGGYSGF
ncbi:transposable element Tcb1 transposase [Trichonephila clavipes]|nr:transposable element Tcb1 transposase [Trichonephila clavipes]